MNSTFDERAQDYHSHAWIQQDLASWTAEWLETQVDGLHAVEFGAGTGNFTQFLVSRGMKIRALELSPRMIEVGSGRVPEASWEQANAWNPGPFQCDRIFSSALLQWCPEPFAVLNHWKGCLSAGGRLLCGLFVSETLPELRAVLPGLDPFKWRSDEEWNQLFTSAGFSVVRKETMPIKYRFSNAREVLRYMHRIGSVVPGRSSLQALRNAIKCYDSHFAEEEGVPATWTFLRIECLAARSS